jgi:hypothetical protein
MLKDTKKIIFFLFLFRTKEFYREIESTPAYIINYPTSSDPSADNVSTSHAIYTNIGEGD